MSDGFCDADNNNEECQYDGGDCCSCDCVDDDFTCGDTAYDCLDVGSSCYGDLQCSGVPNLMSNGECDADNNNEECEYDGGDCCSCDCTDGDYICGSVGYNCLDVGSSCYVCGNDEDCNVGYICCEEDNTCKIPIVDTGACGDPHMTGFRGQKFDFTGKDGGWYAVISDMPHIHLNMRVTSPVPSVPDITYITGIGITTIGDEGSEHTIVITVADPHSLDSACPIAVSPCLADGALVVEIDGEVTLLSPGEIELGPNVAISAVNLPGACRSFGFEKYWERKKEEYARGGRKLSSLAQMEDMSEWILGDPTATNMAECSEYVVEATADGSTGLFEHESEHTSFQILTSKGKIRLSHGRLHQLAVRDPTDRFDIPDHLTWQMNLSLDRFGLGLDATGILGETQEPTLDANGQPIMQGMAAIRGVEDDYLVEGPLDSVFAAAHSLA
ncbi:unnamed protein product [Ectocarpus fasciculatus]